MSSTKPSDEQKKDSIPPSGFGWNVNQTLNQLHGFADTKLSTLLAGDLTIVVVLLANKPSFHPVTPNPIFQFLKGLLPNAPLFAYAIAVICFLLSAILATVALCSYRGRTVTKSFPYVKLKEATSVILWRDISRRVQAVKYQESLQELKGDQEVENAYAVENWRLSKEFGWKNFFLQWSFVFFIGGLVFAFISTGASFFFK